MIGILINSLARGGAERIVLNLFTNFNNKGIHSLLITLENNIQYDTSMKDVNLIGLSNRHTYVTNFSKLISLVFLAWRLKSVTRKNSIVTIQSHLIRSNIINVLSKFLGSKHKAILVNHSIVSHNLRLGIIGKIKLVIMRLFYSKADQIVFISKEMQNDFQKTLHLKVKQTVIYNPHNINDIIVRSRNESDFFFNPKYKYIIYFGRLTKSKNVDDLIYVFSELRKENVELKLIILGNGEELDNLKELVISLRLEKETYFIDSCENPYKYLSRCKIFVLPSSREGLPNSLIESMICKTIVVSADCSSGPREIISPDSEPLVKLKQGYEITDYGILYAIHDKDALNESLRIILSDDYMATKIRKNAFERSQVFDLENILFQHISIIKST